MDAGVLKPPEESAIRAACARLAPQRRQLTFLAKLWYPHPSDPHFQSPARKGTVPDIVPERDWVVGGCDMYEGMAVFCIGGA